MNTSTRTEKVFATKVWFADDKLYVLLADGREVGVPIDIANLLAWTIVRYEVAQIVPTPQQQQLLRQYCRFICRAELWQSNLLG